MDGTSFVSILLALIAVALIVALLVTPESLFQEGAAYIGHHHIGMGAEAYGVELAPVLNTPAHPKKPQPLAPKPQPRPRGRSLEQILENP